MALSSPLVRSCSSYSVVGFKLNHGTRRKGTEQEEQEDSNGLRLNSCFEFIEVPLRAVPKITLRNADKPIDIKLVKV